VEFSALDWLTPPFHYECSYLFVSIFTTRSQFIFYNRAMSNPDITPAVTGGEDAERLPAPRTSAEVAGKAALGGAAGIRPEQRSLDPQVVLALSNAARFSGATVESQGQFVIDEAA
jgi:hypothetical protein